MSSDKYSPDISSLYHYKLNRILGEGGTGRVYRGIDTKKGEVVAIKLFRENFFRNRFHLHDLSKSVKRFKKFSHPNVVQIFDFIDGKEGRCMIMEYIDGPDLKWYLTNRPWNLIERINIANQMCAGLQYLHDNDCVHHDIKPANILFTRKGQAKLADFSLYGSSFLLELVDKGAGEQITPMYVAPEVIRKEGATPSADQYSLGITFYMLFAGRVPFQVDTLQKLYHCHLHFMPDHPHEVNPQCPRAVGDIIMKMLGKKPKDRFADCDQLRIALSDHARSRI
ncbi:MAG: serine/threonine protein kinase [Candidatus Hydrogenedentes bacterium]|nr:serine/threonine protein kinase [Candidatus Hydrogenedentota bacterium]